MAVVAAVNVERLVARRARVTGRRARQYQRAAAVARRCLGWKAATSKDGRLGCRTIVDRGQTWLMKSVAIIGSSTLHKNGQSRLVDYIKRDT